MSLTCSTRPETLMPEEQRSHFATRAFYVAEKWANGVSENLTVRERVHGAVHGMLQLLQDGTAGCPAFLLVPVIGDGSSVTVVHRDGAVVEADWDYDGGVDLAGTETTPAVTTIYQRIYDNHRERRSIAAHDLFSD